MNMFKKNGGFTLVELIVVIAILAILAGVAIPAYSGYIGRANKTADDQIIEGIETSMLAALAMEGLDEDDADDYFTVTFEEGTLTINKVADAENAEKITKVFENFMDFNAQENTATLKYYEDADALNAEQTGNKVLGIGAGTTETQPESTGTAPSETGTGNA